MCLWYNQKPMKVAKHWRAIVCSIPSSSSFSFILTVSLSFFFPLDFRKQSFYKNENLASRELQVYLQLCYRSFDIIAYFPVPLELSGKTQITQSTNRIPVFFILRPRAHTRKPIVFIGRTDHCHHLIE